MKRIVSLALMLALLCTGCVAVAQEHGYVAAIYVEDEISEYAYAYDHLSTLQMINAIVDDPENCGIFLYLNSPGGYLYESDELYEKLMYYKKETGRKIYCYIGAQACSGAFYAAMAADYIAAGKMSEVGNVGVYLETMSYDGLYEKLGIEHNVISTGENKLEGIPTLTDAQREIVTSRIDEALGFFVDVIMKGRALESDAAWALTDGRVFTATQAKERGLIDAILTYDAAQDDMYGRFFGGAEETKYIEDILGLEEEYEGGYGPSYLDGMDFENPFADWLFGDSGMKTHGERLLALRRN